MKMQIKIAAVIAVILVVPFYGIFAGDSGKGVSISSKKIKQALGYICPEARIVSETDLNVDMRKYLDGRKIKYKTVIQADFNGDNLGDLALLVVCSNEKSKAQEKLIVMLQKSDKTYDARVLEEFPAVGPLPDDSIYICLVGPGKIQGWDESVAVNIKYNSIERIFDEKSSGIYYWDKGQFLYLQKSD